MPVPSARQSRRPAVSALATLTCVVAAACAGDQEPPGEPDEPVGRLPRIEQPVRDPNETDLVLPEQPLTTTGGTPPVDRPNVLLITLDDASWEEMRYLAETQRLIAEQGVTLANGIAPTPLCVPARASLLTGQYAHNHGAQAISGDNGGFTSFDDGQDDDTLPVWLRDNGYDTLFAGKYLNGYGGPGTADTYIPPGWSDWRATVDPSTYNYVQPRINDNGTVRPFAGYSTDVIRDLSVDMLSDPDRTATPWFMWVNYVAPHSGGPDAPDDPRTRSPSNSQALDTTTPAAADENDFTELELPEKPSMFEEDVSDKAIIRPTGVVWTPEQRAEAREMFQQRVEALQSVDRAIEKTVATLAATGQLDETYIILTSDNGFLIGEHNLTGKLWYFRESLGIPMYIRGPGLEPGSISETPVSNADWAPTIAAMTGATPTVREVDGVDVFPWLGGPARKRIIPISAYPVRGGTEPFYRGVVVGPWTYVIGRGGRAEVYHRSVDPYELYSLRRDPRYAAQSRQLGRLNGRADTCAGDRCPIDFYE
jgi:arylsulfatase A-like enzyme